MAKRKQKSKKTVKASEEKEIMNETEYKSMLYVFLITFIGAILFLLVYLIGLINILLK